MKNEIIETVGDRRRLLVDVGDLTEQQVQELLALVKQKLQEAQVPILLKG